MLFKHTYYSKAYGNYITQENILQCFSLLNPYIVEYKTPVASIPHSIKWWREKALANLVNLEYFAKVLPIQIYIIKLQVDKTSLPRMNTKDEISQGTCMAKGQPL